MNNKEKFDNLMKDITWDNWEKDAEGNHEEVKYFDLCEVFYNKLEWVKENIEISLEDMEHYDTLEQVQVLLSLLSEEKIKSIL